jgi:antiviral helicase SKI2
LPSNGASMHLKICKIPVSDVECITTTRCKAGGPIWYLNIKKGECLILFRLTN